LKVTLEKDIVEELIEYKLRNIKNIISNILSRWNEDSAEIFLKKARDGTYPEAENDAIDLKQLLLEEKKLIELLDNL
jgi:hypothetical protein